MVDKLCGLALDGDGNVLVAGTSYLHEPEMYSWIPSDWAIVKFSSAGEQLWAMRDSGKPYGVNVIRAFSLDAHGTAYVTGQFETLDKEIKYATAKISTDGYYIWMAHYEGSYESWHEGASALAIDSLGNVYVTGATDAYTTVKYNAEGEEVWMTRYKGPKEEEFDVSVAIALDESGNLYVTGNSPGPGRGTDITTVKYPNP